MPQCFTDIWFCLQSEALDLNLGMEQEVGFQNSKIIPHRGGNETRISSLWSSLKADGSRVLVLLSRLQCLCSPAMPCPTWELLQLWPSVPGAASLAPTCPGSYWKGNIYFKSIARTISYIMAKAANTLPWVESAFLFAAPSSSERVLV